MRDAHPFQLTTWSIDPPLQLLRDPSYIRRSAERQRALILLTSVIILVCNPPFYIALTAFPGLPPESLTLRVLPMVLAIIAIPLHWRQRSYMLTRLSIMLLLGVQMMCSLTQVIDSLNSPVYVAACLTPLYACQMIFNRLKDLLVIMAIALGWYILLYINLEGSFSDNDVLALLLFTSATFITSLFGAIRIKDLERTYLAQHESAQKSIALKQAEANARNSAEAALAASRAKSAFLATMSHELRTPLNAIIGYSELLIETAEEDGHLMLTDDLTHINTSAAHLLTLISGVLDLSKVEAGRMELVIDTFAVDTIINELAHVGRTLCTTHSNTLIIATEFAPKTLHTDPQKLRQILLNLLSNASKFTDHGTITLEVVQDAHDHVIFHVQDTGIGISKPQQALLFQPFSQVHGKLERERYGGTGLGLMLCKRMAELLHGSLTLSSQPGRGSTFSLRIPLSIHDATPQK